MTMDDAIVSEDKEKKKAAEFVGFSKDSDDAEAAPVHMHAGRYWFEIGNNPRDFNFEKPHEKENISDSAPLKSEVQSSIDSSAGNVKKKENEPPNNVSNSVPLKSEVQRSVDYAAANVKKKENEPPHNMSNSVLLKSEVQRSVDSVAANVKKKENEPPHNMSDTASLKSEVQRSVNSAATDVKKKKKQTAPATATYVLDSSDDEVEEIAVPPPPVICLDSSDDESSTVKKTSPVKALVVKSKKKARASPVPSVLSSASDDFLQIDAVTTDSNFNFNLHGSDLANANLNNSLVSKTIETKKKSKKVAATSKESCFATPKERKRNLKKRISFTVNSNVPVPNIDVYESESSDVPESVIDMTITPAVASTSADMAADESSNENYPDLVIANVSGNLSITCNVMDTIEEIPVASPPVLVENDESCIVSAVTEMTPTQQEIKRMRDYYDNSWGGEKFDHKHMQGRLPSDKSLWQISPKDFYNRPNHRKFTQCNYCNRSGHRGDQCQWKPKICFMCGTSGHTDWNCPHKLCLNCGSKSNLFINSCRQCYSWNNTYCDLCRISGHPTNRCPDNWRRYHLTATNEIPLLELRDQKPKNQQFCSGCANRGHVASECKNNPKLCFDFQPACVYIRSYKPMYTPDGIRKLAPDAAKTDSGKNAKRKSECDAPKSPPKRSKNKEEPSVKITTKTEATPEQVIQDSNVSNTSDAVTTAQMFLSAVKKAKLTDDDAGKLFLDKLSSKCNIKYAFDTNKHSDILKITGTQSSQTTFRIRMKDFLLRKTTEQYSKDESLYALLIPNKCKTASKKIQNKINSLQQDLGHPSEVFKLLNQRKEELTLLINAETINERRVNLERRNMNRFTQILNMILIGQAGLSGGKEKLNMLQSKVKNLNNQKRNMLLEERIQIGRLYHPIFSYVPRDDYVELLEEYNKKQPIASGSSQKKKIAPLMNLDLKLGNNFHHMKMAALKNQHQVPERFRLHNQLSNLNKALQTVRMRNVDLAAKKMILQHLNKYRMKLVKGSLSGPESEHVHYIIRTGTKILYGNGFLF